MRITSLCLTLIIALQSCSKPSCSYDPISLESNWTAAENSDQLPFIEEWWSTFEDTTLCALIEQGYRDNYSLKSAYEKVVQAYYLRRQISSRYFPEVDGTVDASESLSQFAFGSAFLGGNPAGSMNTINFANGVKQELFLGGIDALWEIDLFGHTYHEMEVACAQQGSFMEAYHAVKVVLAAEIARHYFFVRWQQAKGALLEEEIMQLKKRLMLTESLRGRGVESDFPLLDITSRLESLREQLSQVTGEKEAALYKITALLGELPSQAIDCQDCCPPPYPEIPSTVAVGLPAELLRRRPDIRKAEVHIFQAAAEVSVAVADFFPRLNLTGSLKWQRTTFDSTTATGPAWSYGIHFLAPLFQGGRLQAQLQEKKAFWRQNVYDYYETVVSAIAEAEGAIALFRNGKVSEEGAKQVYLARQSAYLKKEALREAGIVNEILLLDAKIQQIEAQLKWYEARYQQIFYAISLYKALGGGWRCDLYVE